MTREQMGHVMTAVLAVIVGGWTTYMILSSFSSTASAQTLAQRAPTWVMTTTTDWVFNQVSKSGLQYATVLVERQRDGCVEFRRWIDVGAGARGYSANRVFMLARTAPQSRLENYLYEKPGSASYLTGCTAVLIDMAKRTDNDAKEPNIYGRIDCLESDGNECSFRFKTQRALYEP